MGVVGNNVGVFNIVHVPCCKMVAQCLFQQLSNSSAQKYINEQVQKISHMFRPLSAIIRKVLDEEKENAALAKYVMDMQL